MNNEIRELEKELEGFDRARKIIFDLVQEADKSNIIGLCLAHEHLLNESKTLQMQDQ